MTKITKTTKRFTHELFNAQGIRTGHSVDTEETKVEESYVEDEFEDEFEGCKCCDCEEDADGVPIECQCNNGCPNTAECDERCYADVPVCSGIDIYAAQGVNEKGDCSKCIVADECEGAQMDAASEAAVRKSRDAIAEAADKILASLRKADTPPETPRMVVISGKGLDSLSATLAKLGVQ